MTRSQSKTKITPSVLTDRQRALLAFIQEYIVEHKYPPTYGEMQDGLRWSTKSLVDYHLRQLEKKGRITRGDNTSRAIEVIDPLTEKEI